MMTDSELITVGIDPGLDGAVSWFGPPGIAQVWSLPVRAKTYGKGKELDLWELRERFQALFGDPDYKKGRFINRVIMERVNAMPGGGERKMGASSAFSFGRNVGHIEGLLACYQVLVVRVTSQVWKTRAGLKGKPKEASLSLAMDLYPQLAEKLANEGTKNQRIGMADALLIARFGEWG